MLKNIMVEQKRMKNLVEGVKYHPILPKALSPSDCSKVPIIFPDQIQLTETTDVKEKQNLDKTGISNAASHYNVHCKTLGFHHIIPKPNTKSPVWIHFGLPADETGHVISIDTAVCKLCSKPVSAKGGGTTNLLTHLKYHHQFEFKALTFF